MRNLTKYMSLMLFATVALGCRAKVPKQDNAEAETTATTAGEASAEPAATDRKLPPFSDSTFASKGRVVAIGDVHGDFAALQRALKSGGLVDETGAWIGKDATLVQTGDLRYVTPNGFAEFNDVPGLDLTSPRLQQVPEQARARAAAFMPGGPFATMLAGKRVIAIVDDSVFVHGGVLPHHVKYGIDALNAETADWMRNKRDPPMIMQGDNSPIWTRVFSSGAPDCKTLDETLEMLGVRRMVVGHTPQLEGVTSACDEKVWRVDVGMAAHYGGKAAALEITADGVKTLTGELQAAQEAQ